MLIDTHTHLDDDQFQPDFEEVLARAAAAGVTRMISIGTGLASSRAALALAAKYPPIFAAPGIHPNAVEEEPDDFLPALESLATQSKVAALGETGLDYFRLPASGVLGSGRTVEALKARQADFFRKHLTLAARLKLSVVIHQRAAWDDTMAILADFGNRVQAVFHCFGESAERAREVVAMGHLVSFTGIATFKNGGNVREAARVLEQGQLMVETDCPYLAPDPWRGQRAEPAHTRRTAEVLAEVRGETLEEFARHTTATAERFFRLG